MGNILYTNNNPFVYKEFKKGGILQNLKINDSLGNLKMNYAIYDRKGKKILIAL